MMEANSNARLLLDSSRRQYSLSSQDIDYLRGRGERLSTILSGDGTETEAETATLLTVSASQGDTEFQGFEASVASTWVSTARSWKKGLHVLERRRKERGIDEPSISAYSDMYSSAPSGESRSAYSGRTGGSDTRLDDETATATATYLDDEPKNLFDALMSNLSHPSQLFNISTSSSSPLSEDEDARDDENGTEESVHVTRNGARTEAKVAGGSFEIIDFNDIRTPPSESSTPRSYSAPGDDDSADMEELERRYAAFIAMGSQEKNELEDLPGDDTVHDMDAAGKLEEKRKILAGLKSINPKIFSSFKGRPLQSKMMSIINNKKSKQIPLSNEKDISENRADETAIEDTSRTGSEELRDPSPQEAKHRRVSSAVLLQKYAPPINKFVSKTASSTSKVMSKTASNTSKVMSKTASSTSKAMSKTASSTSKAILSLRNSVKGMHKHDETKLSSDEAEEQYSPETGEWATTKGPKIGEEASSTVITDDSPEGLEAKASNQINEPDIIVEDDQIEAAALLSDFMRDLGVESKDFHDEISTVESYAAKSEESKHDTLFNSLPNKAEEENLDEDQGRQRSNQLARRFNARKIIKKLGASRHDLMKASSSQRDTITESYDDEMLQDHNGDVGAAHVAKRMSKWRKSIQKGLHLLNNMHQKETEEYHRQLDGESQDVVDATGKSSETSGQVEQKLRATSPLPEEKLEGISPHSFSRSQSAPIAPKVSATKVSEDPEAEKDMNKATRLHALPPRPPERKGASSTANSAPLLRGKAMSMKHNSQGVSRSNRSNNSLNDSHHYSNKDEIDQVEEILRQSMKRVQDKQKRVIASRAQNTKRWNALTGQKPNDALDLIVPFSCMAIEGMFDSKDDENWEIACMGSLESFGDDTTIFKADEQTHTTLNEKNNPHLDDATLENLSVDIDDMDGIMGAPLLLQQLLAKCGAAAMAAPSDAKSAESGASDDSDSSEGSGTLDDDAFARARSGTNGGMLPGQWISFPDRQAGTLTGEQTMMDSSEMIKLEKKSRRGVTKRLLNLVKRKRRERKEKQAGGKYGDAVRNYQYNLEDCLSDENSVSLLSQSGASSTGSWTNNTDVFSGVASGDN